MNQEAVTKASACLRRGELIAYPTEAVWGLGCDPYNESAVQSLLELKQRPMTKGLLLVASSMSQISALLANLDASQRQRLADSWPGPVTWLLPDANAHIPSWIKGDHDTVAIRVSDHPLLRALCDEVGGPIVSTSANRSGEPAIRDRSKIKTEYKGKVAYILEGSLGGRQQPSEIRDLLSGKIVRKGS